MNLLKDSSANSTLRLWPQVSKFIFFAIAYGLAVRLGLSIVAHPEGVASIWPASGLALACLLLNPKRQWTKLLTVIFIVNATSNWISGNPIPVSLGFAVANTVEPFLGAWVLFYFCKSKILFKSTKEIFVLFGVAILSNGMRAFKILCQLTAS